MNDVRTATAKLRRQLAASLALETDPAIRLIHALREVHGTGDDAQEDLAVAAVAEGRAAFWTAVTDHYNQVAGLFLQLANMSGLDVAIKYRRGDELAGYQRTVLYNLDCLIPLNEAALKQLRQAKHEEWARAPNDAAQRLRDLSGEVA